MRIGILDNDIFAINGIRALLMDYQRKTGADLDIWYTDNPAKAIARCSLSLPKTDVMLIDMALNGISGIQVVASIRQSGQSVAIAGMTSYDCSTYAQELKLAGAQALVDKRDLASVLDPLLSRLAEGDVYPAGCGFRTVEEAVVLEDRVAPDIPLQFSLRELEILRWYKARCTTREIAERLHVSEDTVFSHRRNIKKKLHAASWSEAVVICDRLNIL